MEHEGPPIDWNAFREAGKGGRLLELLMKLPRERWAERTEYGTILHLACRGPNVAAVVALLQSGLVDMNARNKWGNAPANWAAQYTQPRALEVLCAAGADLRACNKYAYSPLDGALSIADEDGGETVRVLVANGVRLSMVHRRNRSLITPELEAFERGVLRCRAAVVALLRVKRASGKLWLWDKFLLAEIALGIWATRYDKGWQPVAQQQEVPAHATLHPQ